MPEHIYWQLLYSLENALCNCGECYETKEEVNLTEKTELEAEKDCELDGDIVQAVCISEFTDIPCY